jgi:aspartyl-tRNA(Asn)/glutamyl-tRNA(Gln) amidotransferase subunit A
VRSVHEAALAALRDLGASLRFMPIPDPDPLYRLTNLVNKAEAAALHARWLKERPEQYALSTSSRIEAGFHIPATAYIEALNLRPKVLRAFVASVFESLCDALYVPVLTSPVPTIAEMTISASGNAPAIIEKVTRCTRWVSYLGLPGAVFPCGFADGLPVAGQLIGRPFTEGALLGIVNAYQSATAWHRHRPGLKTAAAT